MKNITIFLSLSLLFAQCEKNNEVPEPIITSPNTPSELRSTSVVLSQIDLKWSDNSNNELGFKIERKKDQEVIATIATVDSNVTTFSDKNVAAGSAYTYRVVAYNQKFTSSPSNEILIDSIGFPAVSTLNITDTTGSEALTGGDITNDGGSPITARGVVWGINPLPTISLTTKTIDGTGSGNYISKIIGMVKNTKYYMRAYATNVIGTSYGSEINFTTPNIDLQNALVAYFPFKNNANDSSVYGNHGIINGATLTTDRFSISNSAYDFNGYSSYIDVPSKFYNNGWDSSAVSIWFNPRALTNSNGGGQALFNTSPHNGEMIGFKNKIYHFKGTMSYSYWDVLENSNFNAFPINLNQWYHIVIIKRKSTYAYYLNGKLDNIISFYLSLPNNQSSIRIGAINGSSTNPDAFNGKIDDLRFYSRPLTEAEILYLFKH